MHFDRSLPFVGLIFRHLAGDDVWDQAISCLQLAEEQYDLQIWPQSDNNQYIYNTYLAKDDHPFDIPTLFDPATSEEQFYRKYELIDRRNPILEETIQTHLFPFLSATSCVLQGGDFTNDHFLLFSNRLIVTMTQRAWGGIIADWANLTHWMGKSDWTYVHFYMDFPYIVPEYREWAKAVVAVIQAKCERALQQLSQHGP